MSHRVKFPEEAFNNWNKLDKTIQSQFAKRLKKCTDKQHFPSP